MITLDGITKSFGSRRALTGVDLEVPVGSVKGLLGPNGAGKTTVVRVLTTLLRPDLGEASVAGHSVRRHGHRVRSSLGVSGQYAAVDEKLTGEENLVMVGELYGMRRRSARSRARELLRDFRLDDVPGRLRVGAYSGGMRRRLDLAGAVVARPPVVVLDEPTTGLDPRGRRDTWDAVRSLTAQGTTVLLTTQYLEEADQLADSIAVIDSGRIVAEGTARELKSQAGGQSVDVLLESGADLDHAASVVRRAGDHFVLDRASRRITATARGGADDLSRVLDALLAAGVPLAEAALRQPTLDDVFLRITGSGAGVPRAQSTPRAHEVIS